MLNVHLHETERPSVARLVLYWAAATAILYSALRMEFGPFAETMLAPFLGGYANRAGDCQVQQIAYFLRFHAEFATFAATAAAVAIGASVVVIAWRFEIEDVNGNWSDSYVLREKLNLLLSLLFIGAALLALANASFGALLDWSNSEIGVEALKTKWPSADALKSFASAIGAYGGFIGSALLVALFVPGFVGLMDDIETAGRTHAWWDLHRQSDAEGNALPPELAKDGPSVHGVGPIPVAGWEDVVTWKKNHGLTLSLTDLTASFVALAAPLLSSSLVSVTKAIVGGG